MASSGEGCHATAAPSALPITPLYTTFRRDEAGTSSTCGCTKPTRQGDACARDAGNSSSRCPVQQSAVSNSVPSGREERSVMGRERCVLVLVGAREFCVVCGVKVMDTVRGCVYAVQQKVFERPIWA